MGYIPLDTKTKKQNSLDRKYQRRINKIVASQGITNQTDIANAKIILNDRFMVKTKTNKGNRAYKITNNSIKRLDKVIAETKTQKFKQSTEIQKYKRLYGNKSYTIARGNLLITNKLGSKSFKGFSIKKIGSYAVGSDAIFYDENESFIKEYVDLGGKHKARGYDESKDERWNELDEILNNKRELLRQQQEKAILNDDEYVKGVDKAAYYKAANFKKTKKQVKSVVKIIKGVAKVVGSI